MSDVSRTGRRTSDEAFLLETWDLAFRTHLFFNKFAYAMSKICQMTISDRAMTTKRYHKCPILNFHFPQNLLVILAVYHAHFGKMFLATTWMALQKTNTIHLTLTFCMSYLLSTLLKTSPITMDKFLKHISRYVLFLITSFVCTAIILDHYYCCREHHSYHFNNTQFLSHVSPMQWRS